MRNIGLEIVAKATLGFLTTDAGPLWTTFTDGGTALPIECAQIKFINTTGTTLECGYGPVGGSAPVGATFIVVDGAPQTFRGLRQSDQLYIRTLAVVGTLPLTCVCEAQA